MHSSYALSSDDFAVERDGEAGALSDLWPGGYQPGDRLGVLLNQPMDPSGCSNLICGTNTLFYDHLRETRGSGNFFRYADTYLFGVGCEPGDFNQLDVWPMHKFVGVMQPTAEAVLETINDRRITLLVVPEAGLRCRGEVVLSTWNALLAQVRCVVTYSPAHRPARGADVGARRQQGRRELRRAGDLLDARHRRRRAGAPAPPAPRDRPRAAAQPRGVPHAPERGRARARCSASPRCCRPATRRSRAAPRRRSSCRSRCPGRPLDAPSAPLDARTGRDRAPRRRRGHGRVRAADATLRHTPFDAIQRRMGGTFAEWEGWDWISDFGDPIAEHHAVRETVGVWDESPLQKWLFRGPDALAAADYCFTSDMAGLQVGQVRYGAFCDERGRMLGDGTVYNTGDNDKGILVVTALSTDGDHFRRVRREGPRRRGRRAHRRDAAPAAAGAALARAARLADGRRHRVAALLPLPRGRHRRRRPGLPRLAHRLLGRARLRDLHAARERRAPLDRAARRGPVARHPPLRPRRGRVAAHRVGADLHRLRLLPGPTRRRST